MPAQNMRGIHTDCLLNYETVKYFGGEEYEAQRYTEAIEEYQSLEKRVVRECFCLISFPKSRLASKLFSFSKFHFNGERKC